LETFGNSRHGLCGAECFSFLIRSTPLPKGWAACRQSQEASRSLRHHRRRCSCDEAYVCEMGCRRDNCSRSIAWQGSGLGEGRLLLCSSSNRDEGVFQEGEGVRTQACVADSSYANSFDSSPGTSAPSSSTMWMSLLPVLCAYLFVFFVVWLFAYAAGLTRC
jgi:hypothetical protein